MSLWASGLLYGCATSADLRPLVEDRVPHLVQAAIRDGAIDSRRTKQVNVRSEELKGWIIESFVIEAQPPFRTYEREYQGRKEFLIDVDPKTIHADRFWALNTNWMVDFCEKWALSIRDSYAEDLKASRMSIAPPRCHRMLNPDRNQVYDVIVFLAERGSFLRGRPPTATAERFRDRFKDSTSVYGPGIRSVEADTALANTIDGFAVTQLQVRRYTYGSTFLHAELGRRRLYDSYALLLASPAVLLIVHTSYPPELQAKDVAQTLETVIQALHQPPQ
jgi:hypothetical protein